MASSSLTEWAYWTGAAMHRPSTQARDRRGLTTTGKRNADPIWTSSAALLTLDVRGTGMSRLRASCHNVHLSIRVYNAANEPSGICMLAKQARSRVTGYHVASVLRWMCVVSQ